MPSPVGTLMGLDLEMVCKRLIANELGHPMRLHDSTVSTLAMGFAWIEICFHC